MLVILMDNVAVTRADLEQQEIDSLMTYKKYCGKRLPEQLDYVCSPDIRRALMRTSMSKKSIDPRQMPGNEFETYNERTFGSYGDMDDEDQSGQRHYKFSNLFSNEIPILFPTQFRRQRRGIIEECCRKSCSFKELLAYCRPLGN